MAAAIQPNIPELQKDYRLNLQQQQAPVMDRYGIQQNVPVGSDVNPQARQQLRTPNLTLLETLNEIFRQRKA